ncbi:glycoside hydrolase family 92 protein [Pontibacter qinzhouensis]|uniref:Glycoside hydrolase family 92 protein n=1 Tax=Pontibacter qinzhouensis TaxID=2603253 RepID=A0A5C8JLY2_9BACT|nr:GH92 family glycosyl hydrolase [Pontibacter qinzhouensis]TXK37667.1 glycoside hydrolase family 92 protein [Pontibacter qinzhouensis]
MKLVSLHFRKWHLLVCLPVLGLVQACTTTHKESKSSHELTTFVNPFIGTGAHGHTYPGATVPFGMVQLSPDNGAQGWDWCSGYHYSENTISGFSHTHLSGTGIGDLCDISVMPVTGDVDLSKGPVKDAKPTYASAFSHADEIASAGYYAVKLQDYNIRVELTATERAGFHKYTFPQSDKASVIFNLGFAINWDSPTDAYLKVENDSTMSGYRLSKGWAEDQRVYFVARFSKPFKSYSTALDSVVQASKAETKGKIVKAKFDFNTAKDEVIYLKVAISSASVEGARANLENELPHWNFEQVKNEANTAWNNALAAIQVTSPNDTLKEIFYTALYHTKLAPVLFSDVQRNYKGADGKVHQAQDFTKYTTFSLWDTFRAANPLLTLVEGDRVNDIINSMLSHYRQHGLLPVWELHGNETNTMTGYHAIPVIADAYFKGYRNYNVAEAYEAMKKSAMQDIRGVNFYKQYGYIPSDLEDESVTKNLEYAYDDWCIAQVAKDLGKAEDYAYFTKRAGSYNLLFDASVGFMRGKNVNGTWNPTFDPKHSAHREGTDYTEGNAWQHSWFVPHDVQGLINLHGGNQQFIAKLDDLFNEDSEITGDNTSPDISGLIGQYAHGNEPSHHIAYLYNYAGAPWKTQQMVRQIMQQMYQATPDGISGNEDCGQMSAWYVFSAMGFYPVNPAEGIYVIGSPLFEEVSINLKGGKRFLVVANQVSDKNIYIQSATLNGKPLNRSFISHKEVVEGGTLIVEMGSQPNKKWATAAGSYPPSMSKR